MLLPAGPGDSGLSWREVLPYLSEQCTCYLLETRGRGLSADDPDHSPDRLVEDVLALTDSLGERVGLVGWGSALWARFAASHPDALFAVAVYEPGAGEVMAEETRKRMGQAFARVRELVAEGRLLDGARAFIEGSDAIYSDEDLSNGSASRFWEAASPRLPLFLQEQQQAAGSGQPGATSPEVLGTIGIPVLLLHGDRSSTWFSDSARYVAEHLPDATRREIPEAAHFGPNVRPRRIAEAMARFVTRVHASG